MSRGCIPITFNKGGLPEIIQDNINGFIAKETTSDVLANKIIEVINIKDKGEIVRNAINTSKKFNICTTISELKSMYKCLIEKECL